MIMEFKLNTKPENICRDFPQIGMILSYARNLRFEDTPDYNYIRSFLSKIAEAENFLLDNKFDWNNTSVSVKTKKKPKKTKKKVEKIENKTKESTENREIKETKETKETKEINEIKEVMEYTEQDGISTEMGSSRWPEFKDREKIFSELKFDRNKAKYALVDFQQISVTDIPSKLDTNNHYCNII